VWRPLARLASVSDAEGRLAAPELPAADIVSFLEATSAERFAETSRT